MQVDIVWKVIRIHINLQEYYAYRYRIEREFAFIFTGIIISDARNRVTLAEGR